MDIKTLESFRLSDAVKFHDELNPNIWRTNHLRPEIKKQLKIIAEDFLDELGISGLDVKDIIISGSNAAFSYTPHSDLDLHILIDMRKLSDNEVYRELFDAKKTIYNDSHDITVHGIPVELYVQDANKPTISLGEYSILQDKWLRLPTKRRNNFDNTATKEKYEKLLKLVKHALHTSELEKINDVIKKIIQYRRAGLDKFGEFGPENLAYKALRSQGYITKLYDLRDKLHSESLTIETMYKNPISLQKDKLKERLSQEFEDYDPNGPPPGPEFKPTMPAGTVKVDVSDVYDWYKLGQHISNLKGLGHHDFGKGPPSTIMAFGSEDEEHKYIDALEKTGLTTTDIDPVDPKQPKGMKRQKVDPTYNVNENEVQLDELYGSGDTLKNWDWNTFNDKLATAVFLVDEQVYSLRLKLVRKNSGIWNIEFINSSTGDNGYSILGTGNASLVLSNTVEIIRDFLNKKGNNVKRFTYTAIEPSRQRLYRSIAKRVTPDWKLAQNGENFTLTRPSHSMSESLDQNIPPVLYHATYKPRLKSIKLKGLGAGGKRNWEDSKRGVVYLALDPNVAESYAETSDIVPDEWLDEIVILKISTASLDPNKFHIDSNVQDNAGDTIEYHGVIPVSNISMYKQGVSESSDDRALAYKANLIKSLPQIMKLFANVGKGWSPSKEQLLAAVDTGYQVMKHTGDAKQAGKAVMDELNTLHRMSQGEQGVSESVEHNPQDLEDVADWMNTTPDKLSVEVRQEPIEKFIKQIREMYGTYDEFPEDEARTNRILKLLKKGAKPLPMYVEEGDPDLFVMEGRHRMVAFWLTGMKTIPVAYVSVKSQQGVSEDADFRELLKQPQGDKLITNVPKFLFHATPSKNVDSIKSKGLELRSDNPQDKYEPRIYVAGTVVDALKISNQLRQALKSKQDYTILKINTNGLKNNFYVDPYYSGGAYTDQHISPDSISVELDIPKEAFSTKKNWAQFWNWKVWNKEEPSFIKQGVSEAFDHPYKLKWEKGEFGDYDALAMLDDGTNLSIMFNKEDDDSWMVEFWRGASQSVTGEGDAQRIFATVLYAIEKFIKKEKPNSVTFSASKEVEPGQNAQSRARLYDRLVQRYANTLGYKAFRAETGSTVHYELSRLNRGVAEDETLQFAGEKTPAVNPYGEVIV